ncbi:MAG: cupredoxin family copper-binding protein [Thermoleophilaceae bacterium]
MRSHVDRALVALGAALVAGSVAAVLFGASATVSSTAARPAATEGGDRIAIKGFAYRPVTLAVKVGTRVTWSNADAAEHTSTSDQSGGFDTGTIAIGQRKTVALTKAGTYAYHCAFHPFMHATIVVR